MERILLRTFSIMVVIIGTINFRLALWGDLYTDPEIYNYLGWLQLYVLRFFLFASGLAVPIGLWYAAPARWRDIVRTLLDEEKHEELYDRQFWTQEYAEAGLTRATIWNRPWRLLRSIWDVRRCFVGLHPEDALYYCPGGEEGPRGTTCCDCGCGVPTRLTPDLPSRGPLPGDYVPWNSPVEPDPFRPWPPRCDKEG